MPKLIDTFSFIMLTSLVQVDDNPACGFPSVFITVFPGLID